ncbi:MAG TPA: type II secretion system secretin GspD [Xanthomonadaceae bacterium]|nr:type II secretion system secretin GspD [Xanthomonadaceae bacterium]
MTPRPLHPFVATALLVALAGCTPRAALRPEPPPPPPPVSEVRIMVPEDAGTAPGPDTLTAGQRQIEMGTGRFINEEAARRLADGDGPAGEVTFNFEGESLHAVVKAILGDFLQQNYVIAPGVQGSVTFATARPLRGDQALSVLEMLLRWNNATLVWEDGRYTVLPVQQAIPGNLTPRLGPAGNARGFEVRAVPLRYISATEMEKLLKPYARPEAVISVDNARNMIVLAGTRSELENYLQTVAVFDVDWLKGMSVGIFPLQQAEVGKVVPQLESVFGPGADTPMAGMFRFLPLEGINAVLVITSQPAYLARAEEWLERLDLGGGEAGVRLYVYDVKNVKAADLAATLSDVFGTGGGGVTRPQADVIAPGLESVEIRSLGRGGRPTPPEQPPDSAKAAQAGRRAAGQGSADAPSTDAGPVVDAAGGIVLGATEEVRVSAVEESNALLVRSTAAQWESIRRVIERLDTIPLQVQIEAQILQVNLNDSLQYGVQWFFENAVPGSLIDLTRNRNGWTDFSGTINGGLEWTFIGPNMAAVISALDSVSDVKVLSAPSLVVLNNKSASINVGTQIPVVSSFLNPIGTDPGTGTGNFGTSYVQFRETGITLDVTPRVNPGGLVFMEIQQTDSTPGAPGSEVGGNLPVDQRTITTEVAVQSGQTVLLGGLIKQTNRSGKGGVPFLSRIPVLGGLFGSQNQSSERQELLVVIKPTVIRNSSEARRITEEYRDRFRGLAPLRVIDETSR